MGLMLRANKANLGSKKHGGNVTRTRAADDFATIRRRMEELRSVNQPRAADDFATIRERMEDLRRERARVLAEAEDRPVIGPRPYYMPRPRRVSG